MKKIIKKDGIVLKTSDYKEQAVIATILSNDGINNYIVKGAKKISGGTMLLTSPLTKIEFNATLTDGLNTLTEGIILNNYLTIKQDINKLMAVYPILEKILLFAHQVTKPKIFYSFVNSILDLLSTDLDELSILTIFDVKLTYLLGISPELKICLKCGSNTKSGAFSIYSGGIICDNCNKLLPYDLNDEQTETFKLIYLIKLEKIKKDFIDIIIKDIPSISMVIDKYYEKHLDFISRSKLVTKKMNLGQ